MCKCLGNVDVQPLRCCPPTNWFDTFSRTKSLFPSHLPISIFLFTHMNSDEVIIDEISALLIDLSDSYFCSEDLISKPNWDKDDFGYYTIWEDLQRTLCSYKPNLQAAIELVATFTKKSRLALLQVHKVDSVDSDLTLESKIKQKLTFLGKIFTLFLRDTPYNLGRKFQRWISSLTPAIQRQIEKFPRLAHIQEPPIISGV